MKKVTVLITFTLAIFIAAFFLWNGLKNSNDQTNQPKTVQSQNNQENGQLDENALVRNSDGGNVTVSATFNNPISKQKDQLSFEIALNTHSVDLDGYDLAKMATLKTSDGKEFSTFTEETQGEGHHRTIYLKLKNDGVITPNTKSITLVLKDIAGVPGREFTWDKQYLNF